MIKFLDLKQINDRFNTEFITKFKEILESGWYILGKQCEKFENNFAKYCGAYNC